MFSRFRMISSAEGEESAKMLTRMENYGATTTAQAIVPTTTQGCTMDGITP